MEEEKYKVGEYIKLNNVGDTYSTFWTDAINEALSKFTYFLGIYVKRYSPINVKIKPRKSGFELKIDSGYATLHDLSKNQNLKWKMKLIYQLDSSFTYYVISSNQNHLLITNEYAIEKIH